MDGFIFIRQVETKLDCGEYRLKVKRITELVITPLTTFFSTILYLFSYRKWYQGAWRALEPKVLYKHPMHVFATMKGCSAVYCDSFLTM